MFGISQLNGWYEDPQCEILFLSLLAHNLIMIIIY